MYVLQVEGSPVGKYQHPSLEYARTKAQRLASKEGKKVHVFRLNLDPIDAVQPPIHSLPQQIKADITLVRRRHWCDQLKAVMGRLSAVAESASACLDKGILVCSVEAQQLVKSLNGETVPIGANPLDTIKGLQRDLDAVTALNNNQAKWLTEAWAERNELRAEVLKYRAQTEVADEDLIKQRAELRRIARSRASLIAELYGIAAELYTRCGSSMGFTRPLWDCEAVKARQQSACWKAAAES